MLLEQQGGMGVAKLEPRGMIPVNGKRTMFTYWVSRKELMEQVVVERRQRYRDIMNKMSMQPSETCWKHPKRMRS